MRTALVFALGIVGFAFDALVLRGPKYPPAGLVVDERRRARGRRVARGLVVVSHRDQAGSAVPGSGVSRPGVASTARAGRHALGGAELAAVLAETGVSRGQLAQAWRCSGALVDQFIAGRKPLSLDWIERAPMSVRVRLLQRALDRAVAARDTRLASLDEDAHVRRGARAMGEVAAVVDEVLADGVVTADERPRLAKAWSRVEVTAHHACRDAGSR